MFKKLAYSALSVVFVSSFQLLALILTSQKATPEQLGLLTIIISVNAFLFLFVDFGLSQFLLHKKNLSFHSVEKIRKINIKVSLGVFLISIAISFYYKSFSVEISNSIWLTGVNSIALAITRIDRALFQNESRFKDIFYVDCLSRTIGLILLFIATSSDLNAVYSYLVCIIIVNLLAKPIIHVIIANKGFCYGRGNLSRIREFCVPQSLNSMLNFLTQNMDVFIVTSLSGLKLGGMYGVVKIVTLKPLQSFMPILLKVYTPKIISETNYSSVYLQLVFFISLVSSVIYSSMIIFSDFILKEFFNLLEPNVHFAFSIFCIYTCLRAICMPVGILITKSGETKIGLYYTIFQVFCVGLLLYLFNSGIIVIAFAFLSYQLFLLIPHWFFLVRRFSRCGVTSYHLNSLPFLILPILSFFWKYNENWFGY